MTETLSRPDSSAKDNDAELWDNLKNQFNDTKDRNQSESGDLSPFGSSVVRAANRINSMLENRVLNRAYRMNERFDARQDRKEKLENAKAKIADIGRNTLYTALGIGVLSARAARRGVNKFNEKVGDSMMAAGQKVESGMDAFSDMVGSKVESAKEVAADYSAARKQKAERRAEEEATRQYEKQAAKTAKRNEKAQIKEEKIQARQERINAARERAAEKKAAALARKQERRDKWAARREGLKEYAGLVKEGLVETGESIKDGYEKAKQMTNEQKAKLGNLALRARASGEAAVDTWKNWSSEELKEK
ncbi:hypothetical protein H6796_00885 [Candidatus Nomurabacteria bacterium]|nr:hypothetical protein [Candidatus Nomurabacteria bacterium]